MEPGTQRRGLPDRRTPNIVSELSSTDVVDCDIKGDYLIVYSLNLTSNKGRMMSTRFINTFDYVVSQMSTIVPLVIEGDQ